MSNWRPLSRREDESYDALHDGVPDWLGSTFKEFALSRLTYPYAGGQRPNRALLQQVERELRIHLEWHFAEESALDSLIQQVGVDQDLFLDLADFLLRTIPIDEANAAAIFDRQLQQGGSAWEVAVDGDGQYRLVRRVEPTVEEAAHTVMSAAGRAGQHLRKAWVNAYGRTPEPSTAYREAVRAVEAIGIPIILPRDPKATLGTMIVAMRDAPSKWSMVLQPSSGDAISMVMETMRLLWTSQLDRHGTADESVPLHVSLEEAHAAVHLAVTLVHWFQSGAIKAKP
jgi:hypothetical protein